MRAHILAGLTWEMVLGAADHSTGGCSSEFRCRELPRLARIVQRPNRDAPMVTSYHVDGLATYFPTLQRALDALDANP